MCLQRPQAAINSRILNFTESLESQPSSSLMPSCYMPSSDLRTIGVEHTTALEGFSCGTNWDNSLALFLSPCYIQSCTGIHHLIGYFSTLYRLTRFLITTQINHLARDLDVSRKLSCVLLNLSNKTFSCNAMSSIIIVFFLTSGQFIAKSLSLSFSWHPKHFLTM